MIVVGVRDWYFLRMALTTKLHGRSIIWILPQRVNRDFAARVLRTEWQRSTAGGLTPVGLRGARGAPFYDSCQEFSRKSCSSIQYQLRSLFDVKGLLCQAQRSPPHP